MCQKEEVCSENDSFCGGKSGENVSASTEGDITTYDSLLHRIGHFGRYQKTRFFGICLPVAFISSLSSYLLVFLTVTPEFHCNFSGAKLGNSSLGGKGVDVSGSSLTSGDGMFIRETDDATLWNTSIPLEFRDGEWQRSRCQIYYSSNSSSSAVIDQFSSAFRGGAADEQQQFEAIACPNGYSFDKSLWEETIVTRFNLVCERKWIVNFLYTLLACGGICGMMLFPYLQDRFGRRPTFFVALTWFIVVGAMYTLMPSYQLLAVNVFFKGFVGGSLFEIPWIMSIELVGTNRRTLVMTLMCIVYSLAVAVLPWVAYLCRTWRQLVYLCTLPFAMFYFAFIWLDESPRWLVSTGRMKSAFKVLKRMADENKVDISDLEIKNALKVLQSLAQSDDRLPSCADSSSANGSTSTDSESQLSEKTRTYSVKDVLRSKNLIFKVLIVAFIWGANEIVYEGMNYNVENLGGNQYLVFSINSLVEILSALLIYLTIDRIGRIRPIAVCLCVAGMFAGVSAMVPYQYSWLIILLALCTKLAITASYDIIYLCGSEVFPTVIRASGLGICVVLARSMNLPTAFIVYSASVHRMLPMCIFGALAITAGFLSLFLPETANQDMIDHLEEDWKQPVGWKTFSVNLKLKRYSPLSSSKSDLEKLDATARKKQKRKYKEKSEAVTAGLC